MSEVRGTISAGVCGFVTEVVGRSEDGQHVVLTITSDCEHVRALAARMPELDAYAEIGAGHDGVLLGLVRGELRGCCSGCVVPAGLFKAMQVTAGLALPQQINMQFSRAGV